uniref:Uncharacterized protein n=1 Tax=Romanomermis culicivorax TaxID=13658 RepID=A0A915LAZ2_ROMCU
SSSLSASQNGPFVTDDVVVVTADQSNSGSSIYDEPCLTSSSSASLNDGEELWSAAGDDYSSSSPTPAPPPLSYICTVRTEKNSNHHFNLSKFAFNNVNGSYDSSLLLTSVSALNKHRSKMQDLALRHRLITNQNVKGCGQLILSAEERRTLVQEGYSIPKTLPLTKKEEEALK